MTSSGRKRNQVAIRAHVEVSRNELSRSDSLRSLVGLDRQIETRRKLDVRAAGKNAAQRRVFPSLSHEDYFLFFFFFASNSAMYFSGLSSNSALHPVQQT